LTFDESEIHTFGRHIVRFLPLIILNNLTEILKSSSNFESLNVLCNILIQKEKELPKIREGNFSILDEIFE
jgi:hypothetical protein